MGPKSCKIKEIMWNMEFKRRSNREKQYPQDEKWRFHFHAYFSTFARERLP
jgi:hypothetical protein